MAHHSLARLHTCGRAVTQASPAEQAWAVLVQPWVSEALSPARGASGKHPHVFKCLQMTMGNLNLTPTPLPGAPLENHLELTDQSFLGHNEGITL